MSSIIDALKKSDQNRNNDNNSDLNNMNFSDKPANKSRRGFWWLVTLLILVGFTVLAWQQGWHHDLTDYAKSWSSQPQATLPIADVKNTANPKVNETPKQQNVNLNQLVPPKQSEIKAQSEKIIQQQVSQNLPVGTDNPKKQTIVGVEKEDNQSSSHKKIEETITPITKEKPASPEAIKPMAENEKPDTPNQRDSSLQPQLKQDYLLLHQIDFATRKDIPEVKINIHIFDPEPENRMVLINGERFNIGDTISESIEIVDIVQEGIVVTYDNITFLIPK